MGVVPGDPLPDVPIELGVGSGAGYQMAITPDGKTLYVVMFTPSATGRSYVIPIATATNTPGKRIRLETAATAILVRPDGKTAYVIGLALTSQEVEVTPIATATNTPGKPISAGTTGVINPEGPVVMTPDGRTIYILDNFPNGVVAFSTVTNTPGKMIGFGAVTVLGIAITPDGRTAYVSSQPPGKGGPVVGPAPPGAGLGGGQVDAAPPVGGQVAVGFPQGHRSGLWFAPLGTMPTCAAKAFPESVASAPCAAVSGGRCVCAVKGVERPVGIADLRHAVVGRYGGGVADGVL